MMKNVGQSDRAIRIILGLVIIGLGFYYQSYWGLVGLVPLATAFMSWCPAYLPFHLSTIKRK